MLLGAHTSASGGLQNAVLAGKEIGASTVQLFTANQKQWHRKPLTKENIDLFKNTVEHTELEKIMSHASYLINLGAPDETVLIKSRQCIKEEIQDCLSLGISFVNVHPGAALKSSREECLDRIIESILDTGFLFPDTSSLTLLLETTAGQGSLVGACFEELAYILSRTEKKVPIGVCVDTCHIFASGYDIRNEEGWEEILKNFDKIIGLKYLKALHLNDSVYSLGARKDRHANLGEGHIGWSSFKYIMENATLKPLPKYLETPGGPETWRKEIRKLLKN